MEGSWSIWGSGSGRLQKGVFASSEDPFLAMVQKGLGFRVQMSFFEANN